jgi:hypothetical protein
MVKRPGRGVDHPPLSSAEVEARTELYLYSHLGFRGLFYGELYLYLCDEKEQGALYLYLLIYFECFLLAKQLLAFVFPGRACPLCFVKYNGTTFLPNLAL